MNEYKGYRGRGRGRGSYPSLPPPNMFNREGIRNNNPAFNNNNPTFNNNNPSFQPFVRSPNYRCNRPARWQRAPYNMYNWRPAAPQIQQNRCPNSSYFQPLMPPSFNQLPESIQSRPISPLPGSEEARQKAIAEASARIKEQLNLEGGTRNENSVKIDSDTPIDIKERNKSDEPIPNVEDNYTTKTPEKIARRRTTRRSMNSAQSSSTGVEELRQKILTQFTYMSKGKIQSLVNNPGSSKYDAALQHLVRDMRLHLSTELRNMYNNRESDNSKESNEMIDHFNSIVPDLGVELVSLPDTMVAELSKILQLDINNVVEDANTNDDCILIEPEEMFKQAERMLSDWDSHLPVIEPTPSIESHSANAQNENVLQDDDRMCISPAEQGVIECNSTDFQSENVNSDQDISNLENTDINSDINHSRTLDDDQPERHNWDYSETCESDVPCDMQNIYPVVNNAENNQPQFNSDSDNINPFDTTASVDKTTSNTTNFIFPPMTATFMPSYGYQPPTKQTSSDSVSSLLSSPKNMSNMPIAKTNDVIRQETPKDNSERTTPTNVEDNIRQKISSSDSPIEIQIGNISNTDLSNQLSFEVSSTLNEAKNRVVINTEKQKTYLINDDFERNDPTCIENDTNQDMFSNDRQIQTNTESVSDICLTNQLPFNAVPSHLKVQNDNSRVVINTDELQSSLPNNFDRNLPTSIESDGRQNVFSNDKIDAQTENRTNMDINNSFLFSAINSELKVPQNVNSRVMINTDELQSSLKNAQRNLNDSNQATINPWLPSANINRSEDSQSQNIRVAINPDELQSSLQNAQQALNNSNQSICLNPWLQTPQTSQNIVHERMSNIPNKVNNVINSPFPSMTQTLNALTNLNQMELSGAYRNIHQNIDMCNINNINPLHLNQTNSQIRNDMMTFDQILTNILAQMQMANLSVHDTNTLGQISNVLSQLQPRNLSESEANAVDQVLNMVSQYQSNLNQNQSIHNLPLQINPINPKILCDPILQNQCSNNRCDQISNVSSHQQAPNNPQSFDYNSIWLPNANPLEKRDTTLSNTVPVIGNSDLNMPDANSFELGVAWLDSFNQSLPTNNTHMPRSRSQEAQSDSRKRNSRYSNERNHRDRDTYRKHKDERRDRSDRSKDSDKDNNRKRDYKPSYSQKDEQHHRHSTPRTRSESPFNDKNKEKDREELPDRITQRPLNEKCGDPVPEKDEPKRQTYREWRKEKQKLAEDNRKLNDLNNKLNKDKDRDPTDRINARSSKNDDTVTKEQKEIDNRFSGSKSHTKANPKNDASNSKRDNVKGEISSNKSPSDSSQTEKVINADETLVNSVLSVETPPSSSEGTLKKFKIPLKNRTQSSLDQNKNFPVHKRNQINMNNSKGNAKTTKQSIKLRRDSVPQRGFSNLDKRKDRYFSKTDTKDNSGPFSHDNNHIKAIKSGVPESKKANKKANKLHSSADMSSVENVSGNSKDKENDLQVVIQIDDDEQTSPAPDDKNKIESNKNLSSKTSNNIFDKNIEENNETNLKSNISKGKNSVRLKRDNAINKKLVSDKQSIVKETESLDQEKNEAEEKDKSAKKTDTIKHNENTYSNTDVEETTEAKISNIIENKLSNETNTQDAEECPEKSLEKEDEKSLEKEDTNAAEKVDTNSNISAVSSTNANDMSEVTDSLRNNSTDSDTVKSKVNNVTESREVFVRLERYDIEDLKKYKTDKKENILVEAKGVVCEEESSSNSEKTETQNEQLQSIEAINESVKSVSPVCEVDTNLDQDKNINVIESSEVETAKDLPKKEYKDENASETEIESTENNIKTKSNEKQIEESKQISTEDETKLENPETKNSKNEVKNTKITESDIKNTPIVLIDDDETMPTCKNSVDKSETKNVDNISEEVVIQTSDENKEIRCIVVNESVNRHHRGSSVGKEKSKHSENTTDVFKRKQDHVENMSVNHEKLFESKAKKIKLLETQLPKTNENEEHKSTAIHSKKTSENTKTNIGHLKYKPKPKSLQEKSNKSKNSIHEKTEEEHHKKHKESVEVHQEKHRESEEEYHKKHNELEKHKHNTSLELLRNSETNESKEDSKNVNKNSYKTEKHRNYRARSNPPKKIKEVSPAPEHFTELRTKRKVRTSSVCQINEPSTSTSNHDLTVLLKNSKNPNKDSHKNDKQRNIREHSNLIKKTREVSPVAENFTNTTNKNVRLSNNFETNEPIASTSYLTSVESECLIVNSRLGILNRMMTIDMEIQKLMQEKWELYKELEISNSDIPLFVPHLKTVVDYKETSTDELLSVPQQRRKRKLSESRSESRSEILSRNSNVTNVSDCELESVVKNMKKEDEICLKKKVMKYVTDLDTKIQMESNIETIATTKKHELSECISKDVRKAKKPDKLVSRKKIKKNGSQKTKTILETSNVSRCEISAGILNRKNKKLDATKKVKKCNNQTSTIELEVNIDKESNNGTYETDYVSLATTEHCSRTSGASTRRRKETGPKSKTMRFKIKPIKAEILTDSENECSIKKTKQRKRINTNTMIENTNEKEENITDSNPSLNIPSTRESSVSKDTNLELSDSSHSTLKKSVGNRKRNSKNCETLSDVSEKSARIHSPLNLITDSPRFALRRCSVRLERISTEEIQPPNTNENTNEINPNMSCTTPDLVKTENVDENIVNIIAEERESTVISTETVIGSSQQEEAHDASEESDEDNHEEGIFCTDHRKSILAIKVIGDEFLAASEDGTIYKYCLKTGELQDTYTGHKRAVTCIFTIAGDVLNIDSLLMYSGSLDCTLKCYNIDTSAVVHSVKLEQPIQCMDTAWGHIFLGTYKGLLFIYNMKKQSLNSESLTIASATVLMIKATQEGSRQVLILASRQREIMVRDAFTGLLLRTMCEHHKPTIYSLLLNRSLVYCGTSDKGILVLDFHTGNLTEKYTAGRGVVCMLMHDSLLFAGCYDGKIYIYDTRTQKHLMTIPGPSDGMLLSLAVTDNVIIAGTKKERLLKIWKMPQELLTPSD